MTKKTLIPSQTAADVIASWKWRIIKAGHTVKSFCAENDENASQVGRYIKKGSGITTDTFERIEGKIKALEV